MTISLHRHFVDQVLKQPPAIRAAVFDAMLALPDALRTPAKHTGLRLRKLHASGIWELRVGLGLRILLQLSADQAIFRFLGTHDEVRKYLKNL
jgi:hypothetical protein